MRSAMKSILILLICGLATSLQAAPMKALIIDGQNNHDYKSTTPHLEKIIEETGLFIVDVATTPGGKDMSQFHPKFSDYKVIISNYNGQRWGQENEEALVAFVRNGGGFVS